MKTTYIKRSELNENLPTRMVTSIRKDGSYRSAEPLWMARQNRMAPAVIFVRNDGWSIAAINDPRHIKAAKATWEGDWVETIYVN